MTGRHSVILHLMWQDILSRVTLLVERHSVYEGLKVQYLTDVYFEGGEISAKIIQK